jgi:hypothetical protein
MKISEENMIISELRFNKRRNLIKLLKNLSSNNTTPITSASLQELLKDTEKINIDKSKTLTNTTASQAKNNVKDIVFWGDGDTFKLISKASSVNEGWMKSSKAMQIDGVGCVVQVTTQQGNNVAEAVVFVPNTKIKELKDTEGKVISRKLVKMM